MTDKPADLTERETVAQIVAWLEQEANRCVDDRARAAKWRDDPMNKDPEQASHAMSELSIEEASYRYIAVQLRHGDWRAKPGTAKDAS